MSMIYNGKAIIPAPFVALNKTIVKNDSGEEIGNIWRIVLSGKLVAHKGSPNSDGVFHTVSGYPTDEDLADNEYLTAILNKQAALRELFKEEGKLLEVTPWDGSAALKCNPRVVEINFPEGNWYHTCDYTITLEADTLFGIEEEGTQTYWINSSSEDWDLEAQGENKRVWRLTHRVSAVGKRHYDEDGNPSEAWENAREWVLSRLGFNEDRLIAEGVLDNSLGAYDYTRSQAVSEKGGNFSVTETWTCVTANPNPVIEEFSISEKTSRTDGRTTASIEGTIRGLETRNNTTYLLGTSKWTNAQNYWNSIKSGLLARVNSYIENDNLNTVPMSTVVGYNEIDGIITYNWEFTDRPENSLDPDALEESVNVTNRHAGTVFAALPVLYRPAGPILQTTGSKTAKYRTIQINIRKPAKRKGVAAPTQPNTDAKVTELMPTGSIVILESDTEEFGVDSGVYSRTTTFVWED